MTLSVNPRWVLFGLALILTACTSLTDTGPSAAGYTVTPKERPLGQIASDTWITTRLTSLYLTHKRINGWAIDVDTHHSEVILEGRVKNQDAEDLAVKLAKGINGVSRVTSRLVILEQQTVSQ